MYVVKFLSVPLRGFPAIQALGVKFLEYQHHKGSSRVSARSRSSTRFDYVLMRSRFSSAFRTAYLSLCERQYEWSSARWNKDSVIWRATNPTPWCAGLVVVPKSSGGYQLCVDLTKLNRVVLRELHILSTVDQVSHLLGNVTVFSKLDTTSSFHQVKPSEILRELTTFITPFGRYCVCCLSFGITSALKFFSNRWLGSEKASRTRLT